MLQLKYLLTNIIIHITICFKVKENIQTTSGQGVLLNSVPKMVVTCQGRGSSIKTNFINFEEIAEFIHTDPQILLRFLSLQFGSYTSAKDKQVTFRGKVLKETVYTIMGHFTQKEIQQRVDKFIIKYIVCHECQNLSLKLSWCQEKLLSECFICNCKRFIENQTKISAFMLKHLKGIKSSSKPTQNYSFKEAYQKMTELNKNQTTKWPLQVSLSVLPKTETLVQPKASQLNANEQPNKN